MLIKRTLFLSFLFPEDDEGPIVSSDSDTSLILAVEVGLSDIELSTDHDCEEVKSWEAFNDVVLARPQVDCNKYPVHSNKNDCESNSDNRLLLLRHCIAFDVFTKNPQAYHLPYSYIYKLVTWFSGWAKKK